ncbi:hypothetical protein T484DRAFT_1818711 [Baffinella frigidus]|nr:hypothetical protein T484DRAFT_1818711 [Cryptophyta sp. CCMP2293]
MARNSTRRLWLVLLAALCAPSHPGPPPPRAAAPLLRGGPPPRAEHARSAEDAGRPSSLGRGPALLGGAAGPPHEALLVRLRGGGERKLVKERQKRREKKLGEEMKRLGLDPRAPVKKPGGYQGERGAESRPPRGKETTFEQAEMNDGAVRDPWKDAAVNDGAVRGPWKDGELRMRAKDDKPWAKWSPPSPPPGFGVGYPPGSLKGA